MFQTVRFRKALGSELKSKKAQLTQDLEEKKGTQVTAVTDVFSNFFRLVEETCRKHGEQSGTHRTKKNNKKG